ncbi:MAG: DNA repair protein RadC [Alphaproteobacteria bacterium]|nr:DNA repair protein RadC [Alphaproteobacteria bacterium]
MGKPASAPQDTPHYHGHRQRLRERLLQAGPDALQDYELLEALLFAAIPRRDVKPLAKALLAEFKTLWTLVNAPPERLLQFGLSESAASTLLVAGAIALRAQKKAIIGGALLNNWQRIVDYCRMAMAHETVEQFRLLFLDRKNRLIGEEVQQRGTLDHTPVYPREVVRRALEIGAGAIVLVHNHPSGDPAPSRDDIAMTQAIVAACAPLGIAVHDHLIIGHAETASFKALGLL